MALDATLDRVCEERDRQYLLGIVLDGRTCRAHVWYLLISTLRTSLSYDGTYSCSVSLADFCQYRSVDLLLTSHFDLLHLDHLSGLQVLAPRCTLAAIFVVAASALARLAGVVYDCQKVDSWLTVVVTSLVGVRNHCPVGKGTGFRSRG